MVFWGNCLDNPVEHSYNSYLQNTMPEVEETKAAKFPKWSVFSLSQGPRFNWDAAVVCDSSNDPATATKCSSSSVLLGIASWRAVGRGGRGGNAGGLGGGGGCPEVEGAVALYTTGDTSPEVLYLTWMTMLMLDAMAALPEHKIPIATGSAHCCPPAAEV